jgi:hypothetical protein
MNLDPPRRPLFWIGMRVASRASGLSTMRSSIEPHALGAECSMREKLAVLSGMELKHREQEAQSKQKDGRCLLCEKVHVIGNKRHNTWPLQ